MYVSAEKRNSSRIVLFSSIIVRADMKGKKNKSWLQRHVLVIEDEEKSKKKELRRK